MQTVNIFEAKTQLSKLIQMTADEQLLDYSELVILV
jgi:hypothetical protein